MKTYRILVTFSAALLLLAMAACSGQYSQNTAIADNNANSASVNAEDQEHNSQEEAEQPTQAAEPTEAETEEPAEEPAEEPLSTAPQPVEIQTDDGRTLEGYFYPAAVEDAPVIVLLHWAPGSLDDWAEIAPWLQNRQDELGAAGSAPRLASLTMPNTDGWLDDSWFPAMPEDVSFAVLVFNFGGYGASEGDRATWLIDAQAAVHFAASLPGVDSHRIAALGASIGSDGAVDGCYLFNDFGEMGTCIGALSLSPGNYITDEFTYNQAAAVLDASGYPVWCLAAEDDGDSPMLCQDLNGDHSRTFLYSGRAHGMQLVEPETFPIEPELTLDVMQIIQEWLEVVFGLTLNDFDLN